MHSVFRTSKTCRIYGRSCITSLTSLSQTLSLPHAPVRACPGQPPQHRNPSAHTFSNPKAPPSGPLQPESVLVRHSPREWIPTITSIMISITVTGSTLRLLFFFNLLRLLYIKRRVLFPAASRYYVMVTRIRSGSKSIISRQMTNKKKTA